MPAQRALLVPNNIDNLTAISAEIAALPLSMRDSAARVTPKRLAASVMLVSPRYSRNIKPGWGDCASALLFLSNLNDNPDNQQFQHFVL